MVVKLLLSVISINPLQLRKAWPPIEVTELPIEKSVIDVQSWNAELPIVVTEFPRKTDLRVVKPVTKHAGIFWTLSPIWMVAIKVLAKGKFDELKSVQDTALKFNSVTEVHP